MKRTITPLLLLVACRPPIRGPEECAQFQSATMAWADEVRENDIKPYPHSTDQEALDFCRDDIEDHGFTFEEKPGGLGWFGRFTTTVPGQNGTGVIFLAVGFSKRDIAVRAATICHERVHMYTELRLGLAGSLATYAAWEGRLSFELPAYGVSLIHLYEMEVPTAQRYAEAKRIVVNLEDGYSLAKVGRGCLEGVSLEYWGGMGAFVKWPS